MNPEQAVKHMILTWCDKSTPKDLTGDCVDSMYEALVEADDHWDGMNETRCGDYKTNIEAEYSRNYESESVAAIAPNGKWVGWTYWYGGGKHSDPQSIDWMDSAYYLDCDEKEELVITRTFTKSEN